MEKHLLFVFLYFFFFQAAAQNDTLQGPVNQPRNGIIDGIYIQEHMPLKRGCFTYLEREEYVWNRKVWRSIDCDSAENAAYFDESLFTAGDSVKTSLWKITKELMMSGTVVVYVPRHRLTYENLEDPFTFPLNVCENACLETDSLYAQQIMEYGLIAGEESSGKTIKSKLPPFEDSLMMDGGSILAVFEPAVVRWYTFKDIVQYHLLEDWYFNKELSVMEVNILGIAPVIVSEINGKKEYYELFWLNYPECVPEFEKYQSSGNTLSEQDLVSLFRLRKFKSTKYEEESVFDIEKAAYHAYAQAIYTSRKIRKKMEDLKSEIDKAR